MTSQISHHLDVRTSPLRSRAPSTRRGVSFLQHRDAPTPSSQEDLEGPTGRGEGRSETPQRVPQEPTVAQRRRSRMFLNAQNAFLNSFRPPDIRARAGRSIFGSPFSDTEGDTPTRPGGVPERRGSKSSMPRLLALTPEGRALLGTPECPPTAETPTEPQLSGAAEGLFSVSCFVIRAIHNPLSVGWELVFLEVKERQLTLRKINDEGAPSFVLLQVSLRGGSVEALDEPFKNPWTRSLLTEVFNPLPETSEFFELRAFCLQTPQQQPIRIACQTLDDALSLAEFLHVCTRLEPPPDAPICSHLVVRVLNAKIKKRVAQFWGLQKMQKILNVSEVGAGGGQKKKKDKETECKPFVEVQFDTFRYRFPTRSGSKPAWGMGLEIPVVQDDPCEMLRFRFFDNTPFANAKLIGEVSLPLWSLFEASNEPRCVALRLIDVDKKEQGEVLDMVNDMSNLVQVALWFKIQTKRIDAFVKDCEWFCLPYGALIWFDKPLNSCLFLAFLSVQARVARRRMRTRVRKVQRFFTNLVCLIDKTAISLAHLVLDLACCWCCCCGRCARRPSKWGRGPSGVSVSRWFVGVCEAAIRGCASVSVAVGIAVGSTLVPPAKAALEQGRQEAEATASATGIAVFKVLWSLNLFAAEKERLRHAMARSQASSRSAAFHAFNSQASFLGRIKRRTACPHTNYSKMDNKLVRSVRLEALEEAAELAAVASSIQRSNATVHLAQALRGINKKKRRPSIKGPGPSGITRASGIPLTPPDSPDRKTGTGTGRDSFSPMRASPKAKSSQQPKAKNALQSWLARQVEKFNELVEAGAMQDDRLVELGVVPGSPGDKNSSSSSSSNHSDLSAESGEDRGVSSLSDLDSSVSSNASAPHSVRPSLKATGSQSSSVTLNKPSLLVAVYRDPQSEFFKDPGSSQENVAEGARTGDPGNETLEDISEGIDRTPGNSFRPPLSMHVFASPKRRRSKSDTEEKERENGETLQLQDETAEAVSRRRRSLARPSLSRLHSTVSGKSTTAKKRQSIGALLGASLLQKKEDGEGGGGSVKGSRRRRSTAFGTGLLSRSQSKRSLRRGTVGGSQSAGSVGEGSVKSVKSAKGKTTRSGGAKAEIGLLDSSDSSNGTDEDEEEDEDGEEEQRRMEALASAMGNLWNTKDYKRSSSRILRDGEEDIGEEGVALTESDGLIVWENERKSLKTGGWASQYLIRAVLEGEIDFIPEGFHIDPPPFMYDDKELRRELGPAQRPQRGQVINSKVYAWQPIVNEKTDPNGWRYAFMFSDLLWANKPSIVTWVRRRAFKGIEMGKRSTSFGASHRHSRASTMGGGSGRPFGERGNMRNSTLGSFRASSVRGMGTHRGSRASALSRGEGYVLSGPEPDSPGGGGEMTAHFGLGTAFGPRPDSPQSAQGRENQAGGQGLQQLGLADGSYQGAFSEFIEEINQFKGDLENLAEWLEKRKNLFTWKFAWVSKIWVVDVAWDTPMTMIEQRMNVVDLIEVLQAEYNVKVGARAMHGVWVVSNAHIGLGR
uniref:C2 domain-containing protein n=1 Tax=Chromera velia CCMP2878 TaxID=1169474 RepID=A0A0G4G854_9ALVE|eukprot:Cvel_20717.t1-p1 / transcript=Cvel_20717.t1 / gene=Cvel_20717 / organism=Chromera_velia_CCMP2878 / gene_product=hypothetical protein / transcript_product=hypothetical protein / location=Cvel_scaffold1886:336-11915(-) / protein_length=1518 / sequence_SO=supercontig / SO=protein_coding / is_pseudo=false